jgi:Lar family restriction alleviation protein
MPDNQELKPCPFCGYEASMTNVESAGSGRFMWIVGCNSEDCDVSFHGHARQIDAAKAWNTRVPDTELIETIAKSKGER